MIDATSSQPPDYLIIGHLARDLTSRGPSLGGSAAYAGLTARALGLRVAMVTSTGPDLGLQALQGLEVLNLPAEVSTTFENRYTTAGRRQRLLGCALPLAPAAVPLAWREARIVHLAPIADEVHPSMIEAFPVERVMLTPQGWLRRWDAQGNVSLGPWPAQDHMLARARAAVVSLEDIDGDEARIEAMARCGCLLAVTEAAAGVRLFFDDRAMRIPAPKVEEVDSTGAGDIFAACFFVCLTESGAPLAAARFANALAARSVTRRGMASIPTPEEIATARSGATP